MPNRSRGATRAHLFLVPHFHYDVAYRKTYDGYLPETLANLNEMVRILHEDPDYRFLIEQVVILEEFWKRHPEHRPALRRLAQQGRLEVACGMYTMPDMCLPDGESLVRNAQRGRQWVQEHLGIDVPVLWIADCWNHPGQLPQLSRLCGYRYYAFSRGMRPELADRSEFLWEGIDGTRILTHWMAIGYDGFRFSTPADVEALTAAGQDPEAVDLARLKVQAQRARAKATTPLVLMGEGSDFAMPQRWASQRLRTWNRQHPDMPARLATAAEFFRALEASAGRLPVYRTEFGPLFQGTLSSRIRLKQANRRLENKLATSESLAAAAGTSAVRRPGWAAWWDALLFNQFHDTICGSILDEAATEALELYRQTERQVDTAIQADLHTLAGQIDTRGRGQAVLVFNPCGFARREVVELEYAVPDHHTADLQVEDDAGRPVACQLAEAEYARVGGRRVLLRATCVFEAEAPAFGWRVYRIVSRGRPMARPSPFQVEAALRRLRTPFYEVGLAPSGVIESLRLRGSEVELVSAEEPVFGDLVMQQDKGDFWVYYRNVLPSHRTTDEYPDPMPTRDVPYWEVFRQCVHGSRPRVRVLEDGPVRLVLRIEGTLSMGRHDNAFSMDVHFHARDPRIEYRTRWTGHSQQYRLRACFPTSIRQGTIRHEIAFGSAARPEGEFAALGWMEYRGRQVGLCVLNQGLPGNNVERGVAMVSLMRSTGFSWGDDTSPGGLERGVPHEFRYAVVPFRTKDRGYRPWQLGWRFNRPLVARIVEPSTAREAPPSAFLEIAPDHVIASHLREVDGACELRLYEAAGRPAAVRLRWRRELASADLCDLTGAVLETLRTRGREVRLRLRPFQIATLRLRER